MSSCPVSSIQHCTICLPIRVVNSLECHHAASASFIPAKTTSNRPSKSRFATAHPPWRAKTGRSSKSSRSMERLAMRCSRIRSSHACCAAVNVWPAVSCVECAVNPFVGRQQRLAFVGRVLDHADDVDQRLAVMDFVCLLQHVGRKSFAGLRQLASQFGEGLRAPIARTVEQNADGLDVGGIIADELGEHGQIIAGLEFAALAVAQKPFGGDGVLACRWRRGTNPSCAGSRRAAFEMLVREAVASSA